MLVAQSLSLKPLDTPFPLPPNHSSLWVCPRHRLLVPLGLVGRNQKVANGAMAQKQQVTLPGSHSTLVGGGADIRAQMVSPSGTHDHREEQPPMLPTGPDAFRLLSLPVPRGAPGRWAGMHAPFHSWGPTGAGICIIPQVGNRASQPCSLSGGWKPPGPGALTGVF